MENFSYHVPFYVVTGGVDLAGHSSELTSGQVGLFDRSTFSVATASGSGTEFFFAQGNTGGKDWYGQPVTESHKSAFFYGKDVENMYLSLPHTIQNEEWVIGFNGAESSKSLTYQVGRPTIIKFYFHGQPAYRFFGGPKEYVVSYSVPEDCTTPCTEPDCPDAITDCLTHTQKLIDQINTHTELRKYGVVAKLVNDPFTAVTPNMEKYCLDVCDNGDALALAAVQAQYPDKRITRIGRSGSTSTYEFCQPIADAAPANFAQSASVLAAVCEECPVGSTLTEAKDVYIIRRPLAGTEDLTSDAARDTFADTVGTEYDAGATDAEKIFLGQDGAVAVIQIKVTAGDTVAALKADTIQKTATEPAYCTFAAPSSIAWTLCGEGISSRRTLKIKALQRPDCDADGDRIDDLTAILAGVEGIDIDTLTVIPGVACADDYTVEQDSIDCLPEDCLTNNVTFTYDELPAFEGKSWEVVAEDVEANANRRCGIRITAGYVDPKFGNCSFLPTDYYENEPVKMEISLLQEDGSVCDAANWPSVQQTRVGRIARQSGEWVVREVLMKTAAYLKHVSQFSIDSRDREAFDMRLLDSVDRNSFYNLYYVTFKASYGRSYRKNEQEKFTAVFAFKEGDPSAKTFESAVLGVLTGKSGVGMHINE